MDHAFLVGVLNRAADRKEQVPSRCADSHPLAIAVLSDRHALDVLHHEVRPALGCRAGVEDPRDVRVVHYRQRLTLVGETGEHLAGVHAEFHDFKGHTPANGLALLGQVHGAHAPFAYRSKDLITAEVVITGSRCRVSMV